MPSTSCRTALCKAGRDGHMPRVESKSRRRSTLRCMSSASAQEYPLPSQHDSASGAIEESLKPGCVSMYTPLGCSLLMCSSLGGGAGDGFSRARALLFYAWTIVLSFPLFVFMCAIFPFQYLFDKHRRKLLQSVNSLWATLSLRLFVDVKIEGRENLPADDKAVLYVSNHQVARKTR